ncbi:hypothetical protein [Saccharopolyspora endophytica]|uniref:Uncharacterized protein n=1 Tax=Saccharopolyspora endophytica TaxID=543886 RepID=A0ABS5D8Q9_9PSEU|nr:hypothetical protein [Saccharopolyspora endophytica]MBQ0922638.1 hypothetical protein [Saccharopolyspora endophytica]
MREARLGGIGDDVEEALRSYEAALQADSGGRHADPEDRSPDLEELRVQVITRAEALPSLCRPRPKCEHCQGECEVSAVQVLTEAGQAPQFVTRKRLCPRCRGTGFAIASDLQLPHEPPREPE